MADVTLNLGIKSLGTLDKNTAGFDKKVGAEQFDAAVDYLKGLDEKATVRIVNGRSKGKNLELSTRSNAGNFFSRKPVTKEFFKQACGAKLEATTFALRGTIDRAFEEEYAKVRNPGEINSAAHLLGVMERMEARFSGQAKIRPEPVVRPPAPKSDAPAPRAEAKPAAPKFEQASVSKGFVVPKNEDEDSEDEDFVVGSPQQDYIQDFLFNQIGAKLKQEPFRSEDRNED